MKTAQINSTAYLLEEVFQILHESLDHDPFCQKKFRSSKINLRRLRELLGQEFSFWLAETGNLYFSTLIAAKGHATIFFENSAIQHKDFLKLYNLLLHTSQLMMCLGPQSEQTINSLIKLDTYTSDNEQTNEDMSTVINNTVLHLQHCVCNKISL